MTKPSSSSRPRRLWAALVLLAGAALVLSACSSTSNGHPQGLAAVSAGASASSTAPSSQPPSTPATPSKPTGAPVHIQLHYGDGITVGVGLPVIAFFSKKITDASALQQATTVKVNGKKVTGGHWYFETLSGHPGYPIEGDYRLPNYWPAHSQIFVDIPAKGLSAGPGLVFDDSLTWSFSTGPAHILTVRNSTHTLTVTTDGKKDGTYPVSLGATKTPTLRGTKVIMEKGRDISMRGPGYFDPHVKFTQRLTYDGEYLHAAPWNCAKSVGKGCTGPQNNIGRANSSNGCTNLRPADAEKLYGQLEVGDVVLFPDATGRKMTMGEGYGDWNVPWQQWLTGGNVKNI